MKLRVSLTGKILFCVLLNTALLFIAAYVVMRLEMNSGINSNLLAPAYTRLRVLAQGLSRDLREHPASEANRIVAEAERRTGLSIGVYHNHAIKLAGSVATPPEPVIREMANPDLSDRRGPLDEALPSFYGPVPDVFLIRAGEPKQYWFGVRVLLGSGETGSLPATVLVSTPSLFTNTTLFDAKPFLIGLSSMGMCTLLCWVPLILYLSRSFVEVLRGTERLAEGHFDSKLEAGGHGDEIAQLSAAMNRVSSQLEGFVAGQKRFLGDIAHELTAPIARTHAAVGVLEQRTTGGTVPYVERVGEEIDQMSELVGELLQFSKAGLRPDPSPLIPQRIGEVVETVLRRESTQARVVLAAGGELTVLATPNGLNRALSNLVRNAVRYAGDAGPVTIGAQRRGDFVEITVADQGPGIPEELLECVFAPFYRVDSALSRKTAGSGLGLAIVKSCVEASGGTVLCRNRVPGGLEVAVTLKAG